jgi:hypothetical protein
VRISSEQQLFWCCACGENKLAAEFSFSDQALGVLNAYCRSCHAAYRHAHYLANKADYIRQAVAQRKAHREENRRRVMVYLSTHPCVGCGIDNPVVLEFDHRDRRTKITEVSRMIANKRWVRVLAEMEQCDVRCINCHRRKTARDFGWAKLAGSVE